MLNGPYLSSDEPATKLDAVHDSHSQEAEVQNDTPLSCS